MAEGAALCVKYLLFFFNFVFFLCGVGIIIGGSLVLTIYNDYVDFTEDSGNVVPIMLIAVGLIIFITGFLGCCGAVKENYCMMAMFAGIMVVLLLIEIGVGIAGYVLKDEISNAIGDNMLETQKGYLSNDTNSKSLFDEMHQDLECCGTYNYTDWFGEFYGSEVCPETQRCVPESCCKDMSTGTCSYMNVGQDPQDIFQTGCDEKLTNLITDNIAIIAAVAIVIAVVEVFGIVCACCLIKSIKSGYEVV